MNFSLLKSHQFGRSTIEILGVLAIIGILSITGISGYAKVMEKMKIDNTINEVATIIRTIKNFYKDQKDYSALENKNIISWGVLPKNMVTGTETLRNPFNGNVKIRSISYNSGFVIVYNGLPKKACVAVASVDWGNSITHLFISPSGYELPRYFPKYLDNGEHDATELPLPVEHAVKDCWCTHSTCGIAFFFK
ncbi:MAG: hypothetical protein J6K16_04235 [Alphaproteobacteria bacterium]|nr:hypothetical protein [Alphaproteobacteria bacterium]